MPRVRRCHDWQAPELRWSVPPPGAVVRAVRRRITPGATLRWGGPAAPNARGNVARTLAGLAS